VLGSLLKVEGGDLGRGGDRAYDAVAVTEARNLDELSRRVISDLQAIEGVIRTLPCTVARL
jgi:hypothetical protein